VEPRLEAWQKRGPNNCQRIVNVTNIDDKTTTYHCRTHHFDDVYRDPGGDAKGEEENEVSEIE
jgi:hypothetical protein